MVLLKPLPYPSEPYAITTLHSTMVLLKPLFDYLNDLSEDIFTFHYGLIKTSVSNVKTDSINSFTFHYGLIKTPNIYLLLFYIKSFTFHYGLIKTMINMLVM